MAIEDNFLQIWHCRLSEACWALSSKIILALIISQGKSNTLKCFWKPITKIKREPLIRVSYAYKSLTFTLSHFSYKGRLVWRHMKICLEMWYGNLGFPYLVQGLKKFSWEYCIPRKEKKSQKYSYLPMGILFSQGNEMLPLGKNAKIPLSPPTAIVTDYRLATTNHLPPITFWPPPTNFWRLPSAMVKGTFGNIYNIPGNVSVNQT